MPSDSTVRTAVVLAGGLGTRLRSAVPDLPKPMAPVAGRPFLEHLLDRWIAQGIDRFVLSVAYRHEIIQAHFGGRYRTARIDYVVEPAPLGTGGALLLAMSALDPEVPFLLLNGDTYFAVDLTRLDAFARAHDAEWCISLFRANEAGRYMGMQVESDGRIVALKSNTDDVGRLANGGVYRILPRAVRALPFAAGQKVSLEDDMFTAAVAASARVFGLECPAPFINIGVPSDYHRAHEILRHAPLPRLPGNLP